MAVLEPVHGRRWMPKAEFISKVLSVQADPGLTRELAELIPDTTDDLPL